MRPVHQPNLQKLFEADKICETLPTRPYELLVRSGMVSSIALCGLDGSGKGMLAGELSPQLRGLGYETINISYPNYTTPYGQALHRILHNKDLQMPRVTKYVLFALNRLETVADIMTLAEDTFLEQKKPVYIIFDRFWTSNILTLAYDIATTPANPDLLTEITTMGEVDRYFKYILRLGNTPIFVPTVDGQTVVNRVVEDPERTGADIHEVSYVQDLAASLYESAAEHLPQLRLIPSIENGTTDMARSIIGELNIQPADRAQLGQYLSCRINVTDRETTAQIVREAIMPRMALAFPDLLRYILVQD